MTKACWKQYTLYKGDMIIAKGTVKEIAQQTGLAVNTIKFYARPTYKRKCKGNNHKMLVPLSAPPMTNADKIRSMDDKKLADFIGSIIDCWHCPKDKECSDGKNCDNMLLVWLKQEHKSNSF